jgi:cytochrome P450
LLIEQVVFYAVVTISYNVFFHPLSRFPGPIRRHASILPWAYHFLRGRNPYATLRLHEQYGPVVRISPSEISFAYPEAWKEIYAVSTDKDIRKYRPFYDGLGFNDVIAADFTDSEKQVHKVLKSILDKNLTAKSLKEREHMIVKHADLLIKRLCEKCDGAAGPSGAHRKPEQLPEGKVFNLSDWVAWYACDVISDLALGTSFGCLQDLAMTPYVAFLYGAAKAGGTMIAMWYLGLGPLVRLLLYAFGGLFKKVLEETRTMLTVRMNMETERDDIVEPLIKAYKEDVSWAISFLLHIYRSRDY